MLGIPFFRRSYPALKGSRVILRLPVASDYQQWADLRRESRDFLQPWEPRWAPDELDRHVWRERLRRYRQEVAQGTGIAFLIFDIESGKLAGGISIGHIRHGVAQSGEVGYWMGERFAGRGLMLDALGQVVHFAFTTLHLHRIEAACIPDNTRSIRLLEKAGFGREGLLRSYLRINGVWQDHFLYSLIDTERRTDKRRG